MKPTVLVVDTDPAARQGTIETVEATLPDAAVREAESMAAAAAALGGVDAVVTEYDLGDGTGLELAAHIRASAPDIGCLLYTETTDIDTDSSGDALVEFVPKDGGDDQLAMALEATVLDRSHAAYPVPADEAGRLVALEEAAGSATPSRVRGALNRLTDVAARHFGVEIASISLVRGHEQDVLAARGRDWQPVPRAESICTYTILNDRTMAIADIAEDSRFADNKPLRNWGSGRTSAQRSGIRTGTALEPCVYDDSPRTFSATEEEFVTALADLAMDIIVLGELHGSREGGGDRRGDAA